MFLSCFAAQEKTGKVSVMRFILRKMWHETNAKNNSIIVRNVQFPESILDMIYSGPHMVSQIQYFQSSKRGLQYTSSIWYVDLGCNVGRVFTEM